MMNYDIGFWVAVVGATIVKLVTSPYHSLFRAVATGFSAMFFAYIFTESVVDWLSLNPNTYTIPVAALLTLTGEGLMRMLMLMSSDSTKLAEFINTLRGGKNK